MECEYLDQEFALNGPREPREILLRTNALNAASLGTGQETAEAEEEATGTDEDVQEAALVAVEEIVLVHRHHAAAVPFLDHPEDETAAHLVEEILAHRHAEETVPKEWKVPLEQSISITDFKGNHQKQLKNKAK